MKASKGFLTHINPHGADICAIMIAQKAGAEILKPSGKVHFVLDGLLPDSLTAEELEEDGIYCIGIGRKESAATQVAKALGLWEHERLNLLLKEVEHCDTSAKEVYGTQMSSIAKVMYDNSPFDGNYGKVYETMECLLNFYNAVWETGIPHLEPEYDQRGLSSIYTDLASSQDWDTAPPDSPAGRAFKTVEGMILKSENRFKFTELSYARKVLMLAKYEEVEEWIAKVIFALFEGSVRFFETVDRLNNGTDCEWFEFRTNSQEDKIPLLYIRSDSENVNKAARSKYCGRNPAVIIHQKVSKPHIAVFLNKEHELVKRRGMNVENLAAMLRWREGIERGGAVDKMPSFEDLKSQGTIKGLEGWHRHHETLLFGSRSAPDVKGGTRLQKSEIIEIAAKSFNAALTEDWKRENGVPSSSAAAPIIILPSVLTTDLVELEAAAFQ